MNPEYTQARRRVNRLARVLDGQFRLPGTRYRFGWDGLIGLIPGVDLIMAFPALYSLFEARRLKLPKGILARMVGNLLIDLVIGLVPVVGDFFDFAFKCNNRNARLFEKGLKRLEDRDVIDI